MAVKIPRLVIAGLSGDSGKTVVTLALLTALSKKGMAVAPFKKGPDYIDAAWLSAIAGNQCRNLDPFMVNAEQIYNHFVNCAKRFDMALIEGNRGVFDGLDATGKYSTAELAKKLTAPLVLIVNATKATRTLAALVKGIQTFDPELNLAGVVLNKVAGKRHEQVIKDSIRDYCNIPVLGTIPKLGADKEIIPGRHLGLVTPAEFSDSNGFLSRLNKIAEKYLAIDKLIDIARNAPELEQGTQTDKLVKEKKVNIGFFNDSVFTFYYPENLESLESEGANLVPISSIHDKSLPDNIDALYIGGGFPETQAEKLIINKSMMESVKRAVENNMPLYAECGGLIYLCNSISWQNKKHKMTGVFPVDLVMNNKPAGHGYSILKVDKDNPYFETGGEIKGHEFHYSSPVDENSMADSCMSMVKGRGVCNYRDGLLYKRCLAMYTHIHAHGSTEWARNFVREAIHFSGTEKSAGNFKTAVV